MTAEPRCSSLHWTRQRPPACYRIVLCAGVFNCIFACVRPLAGAGGCLVGSILCAVRYARPRRGSAAAAMPALPRPLAGCSSAGARTRAAHSQGRRACRLQLERSAEPGDGTARDSGAHRLDIRVATLPKTRLATLACQPRTSGAWTASRRHRRRRTPLCDLNRARRV